MALASAGARGCILIRAHPPTQRGQSRCPGPRTYSRSSVPSPSRPPPEGPAAPPAICCLCLSRKVPALCRAGSWGRKKRRPGAGSPSPRGRSSRRWAADGGGPSGAHVDEFLGGNHVPSAVARCHPVFSPPSESLNFAHLS